MEHATPSAGQTDAQTIHETLYDGADVPVSHKDGGTEMVKVRKIPRSEFAQYSHALERALNGDESAECAFYVSGKDATWAESLDDKSFSRVLVEGQRLNFPSFEEWLPRQLGRIGIFQPAIPTPKTPPDSTNGSAARATATRTSGPTRPTS